MFIKPEWRQQFDEEGFLVLEQIIEPPVIAQARAELEKLVDQQAARLLKEGKIKSLFKDEGLETRIYSLFSNCIDEAPKSFRRELHLPGFYGFFFHKQLLDVVELVIGSEIRLYPNYTVRPKLPDWEGTRIWWHQDGGYTHYVHTDKSIKSNDVADLRMLNVWSPLVPARELNGCMQFVPGSHKLGVVPHVSRRYYLEIIDPKYTALFDNAISIELNPGDVVLFSNLLFHQGLPNRSKTVRWNLDWRYQDGQQPTLRKEQGHIARSESCPSRAVQTADEWAKLHFS